MFFNVFISNLGVLLMVCFGIVLKVSILCICLVLNCVFLSNFFYKLFSGCILCIKWLLICMCESVSKFLIICFKCCVLVLICFNLLLLLSLCIVSVLVMCSWVKGECNLWEMLESSFCCLEIIWLIVFIIWLKLCFVCWNFVVLCFNFGLCINLFCVICCVVWVRFCAGLFKVYVSYSSSGVFISMIVNKSWKGLLNRCSKNGGGLF